LRTFCSTSSNGSAAGLTAAPGKKQAGHHVEQLDRIEVEDRARIGVIAELAVVSGEDQQVLDPQCRGAEQVGLQRHPVAVATGDLQDRLDAVPLQLAGQHQGTEAHVGALVVGDVDRRHPLQPGSHIEHRRQVGPFRRGDLGRDREPPGG
jgi:hypothetical protein